MLFTSCVTFVLLVFLLLAKETIIKSTENLTYNLNTQLIESKTLDVGLWLNQRISEIRIISQSEEVMNMDMDKLQPYINRLNDRLSTHYGNLYGTFAIGKIDGKGWVTEEQTIDVSEREYFKHAMSSTNEYVISTPVFSHTNNEPIVLICYPVYNENGVKNGFINGAISLNKISQIVEGIDFYNCTSWIMDNNGNIYTPQKPDNISIEDLNLLKEKINLNTSTKVGTYNIMNNNKIESVIFHSAIPNTNGWSLCSMVSSKELTKDIDNLIYSIFIIWIFILITSIALCTMFSHSISNPIKKLTTAINSIEDGNLDVFCEVNPKEKDEIAVLAHSFNSMVEEIKFLMNRIYEEENEKRSAELKVLQSQINPHFLYNTLDNLQWKAYDYDAVEIAAMIEALSNFFRISLSNGQEFIPLSQEIKHVENYLFIQQKRYEDILKFNIEFDKSLSEITVLKLIIQPIVENAIYHGIKAKLSPGYVNIKVVADNEFIYISVCDDGIGIDKETLEELNKSLNVKNENFGYGLYNVNQRIKLVYGENSGVKIESILNKGTTVTIKIPLSTKELKYDKNSNC
ncbi:cache domain-containing sensor histidine kinase [Clostridium culturomicium]|uniref:cache domain-containing sensor histidine kinase n=1 Tax=Clostridium culturomicium TaxID=1499683 RepID=UPI000A53566A|nr:sensor histidine kinase [Clostridium culturomicium]